MGTGGGRRGRVNTPKDSVFVESHKSVRWLKICFSVAVPPSVVFTAFRQKVP